MSRNDRTEMTRQPHRPHRPAVGPLTRRAVLGGLTAGGALALTAGAGWPVAGPAADRPWTIPALREWTSRLGTFTLGSPVTILVRPGQASALSAEAERLAADIRSLAGTGAAIQVTDRPVRAGEVQLRLGAGDAQLGAEGYRLDVAAGVTIAANGPTGVFYGGRSLLQLLRQSRSIPRGTARDWPRYPERGLMLDIGRKHLTYDWIVDRIHEMSWLKLNYLHLHFTEDLGWRIESERVPRVHSDDAFLTKSQVRSLIDLAAQHHITVVPEVDVPGHMGAALRNYPQFQLRDVLGQPATNKLDFTIPAARAFARGLIEEYVGLFPGPRFHLGFDEFVPDIQQDLYPQLAAYGRSRYGAGANGQDAVIGFANDLIAMLRGHGRTARVAHDGTYGGNLVKLDTGAVVEWWTDFSPFATGVEPLPEPQDILDAGNPIINIGWYPTYYSNLPPYFPVPHPDLSGFYQDWAVHRFRGVLVAHGDLGTPYHDIDPSEPRNRGSRLSVWYDDPDKETEQETAFGIHPRLRIMAQKTWESPLLVPTYAEFAAIIGRVGAAPR